MTAPSAACSMVAMGWTGWSGWTPKGTVRRGLPTASVLAFAGMALAVVPAASAVAAAMSVTNLIGGALVLVLPYLFIALALRGRAVWSKGVGVAVAALMTWLTSYAVTEGVIGLQRANPVRPSSVPFVLLTLVGVAVLAFGLRDLARAIHASGYWARTPAASRLAFLALGYWTLVFVADTYLTVNPPLGRMLMAPTLILVELAAALMLRTAHQRARVAGVLLAAGACLATGVFWTAYAPYLPLGGGPPAVPNLSYYTRLPWPVLLATSAALNLAVAGAEVQGRLAGRGRPAIREVPPPAPPSASPGG
jgi:hypothetical protein